jgi:hypothetical protein
MAGFIDSLRRVLGGSSEPGRDNGPAAPAEAPGLDFERRSAAAPPRLNAPQATVEIGGHTAVTVNWSVSGLLAKAEGIVAAVGTTVEGRLTVASVSGAFTARVVRLDAATGTFALAFTQLDPAVAQEMKRLASQRFARPG